VEKILRTFVKIFSQKKKDFFLPEYAYVSFSHLAIAAILARFYKFDEQP
jgi:hypothetical protein